MLSNLLLSQSSGDDKLYVEDVFSTWLYSGTGAAQTINNGIDLAGKGGLVWIKARTSTADHTLVDSQRNLAILSSNLTAAQAAATVNYDVTALNSDGFSLGTNYYNTNGASSTYTSWTFRKAPKFFDVVTYTGDSVAGRTISHSLGVAPGMIIVKKTDTTSDWSVYHRSVGNTRALFLNLTAAQSVESAASWNNTTPTDTVFTVGNNARVNQNGGTYIAYLFAHDTTTDGVIQCGSYTGTASNTTITLGWEPQFILIKRASGTGNWAMFDIMRGMTVAVDPRILYSNLNTAEANLASHKVTPTATGFTISGAAADVNSEAESYIYLAIRRGPMRVPTDATKVFSPIVSSGSAGTYFSTGFPIDTQIVGWRDSAYSGNFGVFDRLRGVSTTTTNATNSLLTSATDAETTSTVNRHQTRGWNNNGFLTYNSTSAINWNFRRAPGFFDVVCYNGAGAGQVVKHSLGVTPEFIIIKPRNVGTSNVWVTTSAYSGTLFLNQTSAQSGSAWGYGGSPTSTEFQTRSTLDIPVNHTSYTYVAYLFASCPGVSKVGSYTGNGSSLNIDCGFTNGARFVLIKRTDATGDWYVWDTARGIVAANDPYLRLNSTAAEVTTNDSVDPLSSGFTVNQNTTTNINVSGGTYIYLAIA